MSISGFTFIHDAISGGYPIAEVCRALQPFCDEVVCVDAGSTDGTRALLDSLGFVRVIEAEWGDQAGETLARLHAMNELCRGDIVIHSEGDEVYDGMLLAEVTRRIKAGAQDLSVYRIQVEQNGQRCRWYPWPVHRVFPRGSVVKVGETTNRKDDAEVVGPEHGYLWDVTNWFRDCWVGRVRNQAALWHGKASWKRVPKHFLEDVVPGDVDAFLSEEHWTWTRSPFDLPPLLKKLVGQTSYGEGWR